MNNQLNTFIKRYTIISDLHLGHTLRSSGAVIDVQSTLNYAQLKCVVGLDRALAGFIDTLLAELEQNADNCALVLNGDIFDFLHVDIRPTVDTFAKPPIDGSEEDVYGLSFEVSRSRWKLALIAKLHRKALQALARFVNHGGRLIFTVGNHDVDLCFPEVQIDLRQYLATYLDDKSREESHILIESWFHMSQPIVYIEHGHRFDPYTTFPDPIEPTSNVSAAQLAPNFAHFGLRYFSNRVPSFPLHDLEHDPWLKIARWIKTHTIRESWYALQAAFNFFLQYWKAMLTERQRWTKNMGENRFHRREKLHQIATRYGWSLHRIQRLDAMKAPPVGHSMTMFIQALHLDRIALIVGLLVFWMAMAMSETNGRLSLSILLGLLVASAWWWLDQRRPTYDLHPKLGQIAQDIGLVARVPVVVFGHTHQATCESLGSVIWLNPGSWEHLAHSHRHSHSVHGDHSVHYGQIAVDTRGISVDLKWYSPKSRKRGLVRTRRATFRAAP